MREAILTALEDRYNAQISEADATLKIYLENSVGIGEHPQHIDEVDKQFEKIANAEEAQMRANNEFTTDIRDLHSRITTNYKELTDMIQKHHREDSLNQQKLRDDLNNRVGILEKWRWLIIGGSIVIGFALQKMPIWG